MARNPQQEVNDIRVLRTVDIYESGLVTIRGAADILGVTETSVRAWLKEGAPVARPPIGRGRGTPALVSVLALSDWRRDRAVAAVQQDAPGDYDIDEQKARKTAYEADLAEIKARRAAGELVPIDAAGYLLDNEVAEVKAGVLSLPSRVSGDLSVMTDPSEIRDRLRDEINAILVSLSTGEEIAAKARDDRFLSDREDSDDGGVDDAA